MQFAFMIQMVPFLAQNPALLLLDDPDIFQRVIENGVLKSKDPRPMHGWFRTTHTTSRRTIAVSEPRDLLAVQLDLLN